MATKRRVKGRSKIKDKKSCPKKKTLKGKIMMIITIKKKQPPQ